MATLFNEMIDYSALYTKILNMNLADDIEYLTSKVMTNRSIRGKQLDVITSKYYEAAKCSLEILDNIIKAPSIKMGYPAFISLKIEDDTKYASVLIADLGTTDDRLISISIRYSVENGDIVLHFENYAINKNIEITVKEHSEFGVPVLKYSELFPSPNIFIDNIDYRIRLEL